MYVDLGFFPVVGGFCLCVCLTNASCVGKVEQTVADEVVESSGTVSVLLQSSLNVRPCVGGWMKKNRQINIPFPELPSMPQLLSLSSREGK